MRVSRARGAARGAPLRRACRRARGRARARAVGAFLRLGPPGRRHDRRQRALPGPARRDRPGRARASALAAPHLRLARARARGAPRRRGRRGGDRRRGTPLRAGPARRALRPRPRRARAGRTPRLRPALLWRPATEHVLSEGHRLTPRARARERCRADAGAPARALLARRGGRRGWPRGGARARRRLPDRGALRPGHPRVQPLGGGRLGDRPAEPLRHPSAPRGALPGAGRPLAAALDRDPPGPGAPGRRRGRRGTRRARELGAGAGRVVRDRRGDAPEGAEPLAPRPRALPARALRSRHRDRVPLGGHRGLLLRAARRGRARQVGPAHRAPQGRPLRARALEVGLGVRDPRDAAGRDRGRVARPRPACGLPRCLPPGAARRVLRAAGVGGEAARPRAGARRVARRGRSAGCGSQRPFQRGGRFSAKAFGPSTKSSLRIIWRSPS